MQGIAWRWQSVDGAMMKAPLAQEAVGSNRRDEINPENGRNSSGKLELRRILATNSPMMIIQRHGARAAGSSGVYEGDTVRDRVQEIQQPAAAKP